MQHRHEIYQPEFHNSRISLAADLTAWLFHLVPTVNKQINWYFLVGIAAAVDWYFHRYPVATDFVNC
jgi:hypothetical protein